jgi:hypothetical protein
VIADTSHKYHNPWYIAESRTQVGLFGENMKTKNLILMAALGLTMSALSSCSPAPVTRQEACHSSIKRAHEELEAAIEELMPFIPKGQWMFVGQKYLVTNFTDQLL